MQTDPELPEGWRLEAMVTAEGILFKLFDAKGNLVAAATEPSETFIAAATTIKENYSFSLQFEATPGGDKN